MRAPTQLCFWLLATFTAGCGMGDACEELAAARCDCDEALCVDDDAAEKVDDAEIQACKEVLQDFVCEDDSTPE